MKDSIESKMLHNIIGPVIEYDPALIREIGKELQKGNREHRYAAGETMLKIARLMEFIDMVFEELRNE